MAGSRSFWYYGAYVFLSFVLSACDLEGRAWEDAKNQRTIEAVQAYLEQHKSGEHVEDAGRLLNELLAEKALWEHAVGIDDDRIYRVFIDRFPDSIHRSEAIDRRDAAIERLRDDFTPDSMLAFVRPDQGGFVVAPALASNPFPLTIWYGRNAGLTFSFGRSLTDVEFRSPDPAAQNVVVAVLDNKGLIPSLEAGRAYIWRGGETLLELRAIDGLSLDQVEEVFGFSGNGFVDFPPAVFRARP